MKRLTANKTKMFRLCREYGMAPKNALFTKASRTWWLEWIDVQSGCWKVTLTVCSGKLMLTIINDRKDEIKAIPMALLEQLGMIDTVEVSL